MRHWLQLALTRGIGPILIRRLIDATGGAEPACDISLTALREIEGIGRVKADSIHTSLRQAACEARAELDRAAAAGVALLCPDDPGYPVLLRNIPDPPAVLYLKGTLEDRDLNAVAVVGSRACSLYGREQSERFAALLAGAGITLVSGGARGIDSAAHRGAMSHPHGRTVAVLGSAIDVPYPPENAPLFERIAERGAVVSEYPMGTAPLKDNFPRRNRIISGMSRGVLVVEADVRSGALITARQACDDHCRPVFAVPGRVDNPLSAGPHQLIRDGAVLTAGLEDILDNLGPLPAEAVDLPAFAPLLSEPAENVERDSLTPEAPNLFTPQPASDPKKTVPAAPAGLSDRQRAILAALGGVGSDPADVDAIIDRTGLSAQLVLQELTFLSLRGAVKRVDGQTYARRR